MTQRNIIAASTIVIGLASACSSASNSSNGTSPGGGAGVGTVAGSTTAQAGSSGNATATPSGGRGGSTKGTAAVPPGGGNSGGASTASGTATSNGTGCPSFPASTRQQAPYPEVSGTTAACGSWALVDNVCCAQYCSDDPLSDSCDKCAGTERCVAVNSKACKSGQWPESRCVTNNEPWHYSRSTHYGLTSRGSCGFGYYGLCTTSDKYSYGGSDFAAKCDAFCKAYPDLCADPTGTTLRGNFAAPQGNYYSQFWPSLEGDRDNYLSCGECFELIRTKPDGSEYQPGEAGYTAPVTIQVSDSCPCAPNSKWCCGSGRDHCAEIKSNAVSYTYGCPLPPGDLPADHDPQPNESIHFDLSDIAMARLQSGSPEGAMKDGVIPTRYRRVPCPALGNIYLWMQGDASDYYFAFSVVNASGSGAVVKVEAQLKSGDWVSMQRDGNYTSSRPQERFGTWVVPQGAGQFALPVNLRFTSASGQVVEAPGAIKSYNPTNPALDKDMYYIDTGAQF